MKNKKNVIGVIIVIAVMLLFPIPLRLKDGGSIEFKAILYSVTKYHQINPELNCGYVDGIEIKILGKRVIDTRTKKLETIIVTTDEYSNFVGTILEETTTYMIVRPNDDESEIKSADKIIINYGTDHKDYLYGVGRKVVIKYKGYIKETYPAQIDTNSILAEGYEDFELYIEKSADIEKTKILNNKELYKNNSDYDLYYYGLDEVNVKVDGKTLSLEKALKDGKLTLDGIIEKANKDASNNIIKYYMYKEDGTMEYYYDTYTSGTMEYYYDTYTIIKKHSLDGDRDVYIGIPEMRNIDI